MKQITFRLEPGMGSYYETADPDRRREIERILRDDWCVQAGSVVIEDVPDPVVYEEKQFLVTIKAPLPNGCNVLAKDIVTAVEETWHAMFGERCFQESMRHTIEVKALS